MTAIIHIFACHVATKEWTIEDLAAWVAAVEPKDELTSTGSEREDRVFCALHEG
jgi:hypothetical protein